MYFHVLPLRDLGRAYNCTGVPAWERRAFPLLFGVMSGYIRHLFAIGPDTGAQAGAAVQRTFDAVAARLDDGRRYLCGDAFTAADLAFAALAAPALVPPEYGVALPQPDELPHDMAAGVRAFRAHPAGAFALRLFREER
jgi:glutathione S-transferase